MATLAELAEHGIVGSADVLPMPVGPQQPPFAPAPRTFEEKLHQDVARLQGLLAEAVRDTHRARSERDLIRERVSEPFGCSYCGVEKRSHGRRYIGGQGMHAWERPSDEQVKARMLARRVARSPLPTTPELDQVYDDLAGANLARWEEERTTERLRWALASAKRGRARLRSQVAALEHTVQGMVEGLNGYDCPPPGETPMQAVTRFAVRLMEAERLLAEDGCSCPPADRLHQVGCPLDGVPDAVTQAFASVAALREDPPLKGRARLDASAARDAEATHWKRLGIEDPHDGPLAHSYRVPHDLPVPDTCRLDAAGLDEVSRHFLGGGAS
jgi:hypothetical protein